MQSMHCCNAALIVALHSLCATLNTISGRNPFNRRRKAATERKPVMIFSNLLSRTQDHLAKRRQYKRLVAEIEALSPRDLTDMRADRREMLYHAYKNVYG